MKEMDDDEEDKTISNEYKVILIGESGVGKTSILKCYIEEKFKSDEKATISAEYVDKIIELDNGIKIKLNIWDTVGQENYRSMTKAFYNNVKAALLVYDITDEQSFKEVKDYWYNEIKKFSPIDKSIYI